MLLVLINSSGILLLFSIIMIYSVPSSYAQTTTTTPTVLEEGSTQNNELKEQVATTAQQTTLPIDTITIGAIATSVGGLLLKDRKDKKDLESKLAAQEIEIKQKEEELKKKNMEIVEIIMDIEVINYKIFNSAYIYDTKTFRQILDLKSTNNPLEKNTIGEEYAIQINKLARFTEVTYNVPRPNMSIPTTQVIQASSVSEQIQTVVAKTPPPPHVVPEENKVVQAP